MPLLKMFNVSKPPRMAVVVPRSSEFCAQNSSLKSVHGSTLFNRLFSKGLRKAIKHVPLLKAILDVSGPDLCGFRGGLDFSAGENFGIYRDAQFFFEGL